MRKVIWLIVFSFLTVTESSPVKLSALTTDGVTYYIDLYGMTISEDSSEVSDFEIFGDTSERFAIDLDGDYLSYSVYDDGAGHETVYFDLSEEPTWWRFDSGKGLIYSDDFEIDWDGEYIYYISLTFNSRHGYYMNIKRATYLPINVARFSFVTESGGTGQSADNISDSDDPQGSVSFDILGRVCDGSGFGIRLSGNKSYINLKKEDQ